MDELELLVQAILSLKDTTKSKQQILSELPKLEQQLQSDKNARVNIVAGLDIKKSQSLIQSQLNTLASQTKAPTIKVGVDIAQNNTQNTIVNGLKNIQTQANASASSIKQIKSELLKLDTTDVKNTSFKMGFDKDMVFNLEKTLSNAQKTLSKFGDVDLDWKFADSGQIDKITAKITDGTGITENFIFKLNEASETFSFFGGSGSTSGVDKVIESEKKLDSQIKATTTSLNQQLYNIQSNATMGSSPIKALEFEDGGRLKEQVDNVRNSIEALQSADKITMESMESNANAEISKLQQMIKEIQNTEYAATSLRKKGVANVKNTQTGELDNFINQINSSKVCLKDFDSETGNTIENLKKSLNSITDTKSLTEYLNQFDEAKSKFKSLESFYKGIGQYDKELDKLTTSWKKQGVYTDELKVTIDELRNSLKNIAVGDTDGMSKWVENYNKAISKINVDPERQKQLTKNLDEQVRLTNQILQKEKEIENIKNKPYNSSKISELNKIIYKRKEELSQLKQESATMTDLMSDEKQRQYILDNTSKALEELAIAQKNAADMEQRSYELTQKKATALESQIKTYETINTKAAKYYKSEFDSLKNDVEAAKVLGNPEEIDKIRARFTTLKTEIKAAGAEGQTFFQKMIDGAKKFSSWMSLTSIISTIVRDIRKMVTNVIELDSAMTNLKKVTDETGTTYNKFFKNTAQQAKNLKIDLADLINQTAEWAKKGYNISESSVASKASGIYSVVGEVDNTTAVQDLTTVIKSYNMAIDESIDIVDKFNNISNKYSVNAADIGQMLSNSISSLSVAGNSLDEAIAMGSTITEITGDASEAGNTLKVLSMRLRGASTEIEQIGESTDGMAESTSKLREKILALTNVTGKGGFDIMADADNFKSTYQIMQGISEVWKDMSDVNQASLIEVIAGKQRGNTVSALLTNMAQANKILNDSLNSSGSAMEEYSLHLESIEGRIQGMKTSFESLSATIVNSDFIKGGVDFLTGGINLLDTIIDKLGVIPTLISAITLGVSAKNVGELNQNTPVYALSLTKCA